MFKLPDLPYAYNALEPYLDAATMEIHHSKHHAAYVAKLNEALANEPELSNKTVEELIANLSSVPEKIRSAVRNHGGGHYNHSLFWLNLTPEKSEPDGGLLTLLDKDFGGVEGFKEQFTRAALGVFGSGWAWLAKDNAGKLAITTTANQDNPLSQGLKPLLGLDVWEHAYYLKFQNRRADYVAAWWSVINWAEVARRLS